MEKKMDNEMETGIILGIIGVIVIIYSPSIPVNNPYNAPLCNPLHDPPISGLDYSSYVGGRGP